MYSAPEIFGSAPYGWEVDLWSLGVILFTLLGAYSPCVPPPPPPLSPAPPQPPLHTCLPYDCTSVEPHLSPPVA
eukprot:5810067-Pleurochrysis_carterae.AAC.1